MEFPDLGKHCSEPTCKQLDFLPLKCDACEQIFCKDHITYALHNCSSAYKKDVQVPVCPLCNTPIPVKRGQTPDIVVGEHIDRDCRSDPAQQKRKIFTNKCGRPGCRQKELIKVICEDCHGNFCLKHRHPLDHECQGKSAPISRAGHAALLRSQASSSKAPASSSHTAAKPASQPQRSRASVPSVPSAHPPAAAALQNGLTEEEALQRALEMSLAESAQNATPQHSSQEEEDLALARALSASEEEYRRQQALALNKPVMSESRGRGVVLPNRAPAICASATRSGHHSTTDTGTTYRIRTSSQLPRLSGFPRTTEMDWDLHASICLQSVFGTAAMNLKRAYDLHRWTAGDERERDHC